MSDVVEQVAGVDTAEARNIGARAEAILESAGGTMLAADVAARLTDVGVDRRAARLAIWVMLDAGIIGQRGPSLFLPSAA